MKSQSYANRRRRYQPTPYQHEAPPQAPATPTPPPRAAESRPFIRGNPELWTTLQTVVDAASGWTKTTRAMNVPGGCLVNTAMRRHEAVGEALVFVPGARVKRGSENSAACLVAGV